MKLFSPSLLFSAIPFLVLAAGGCSPSPPSTRHPAPARQVHLTSGHSPLTPAQASLPTLAQEKGYVGDRACARCHRLIFEQHQASAHAQTLHPVTPQSDGRFFTSSQRIRDAREDGIYSVSVHDGACEMDFTSHGRASSITAALAIGSGRKGTSYFGQIGGGQWLVMRLSHYAATDTWGYTPGMARFRAADPRGQPLSTGHVAGCLSCHVTTLLLNNKNPDLALSHLGVGCERCHGPGKEHIAAMSAPAPTSGHQSTRMELLDSASANRIMELCGMCHSADASTIAGGSDEGGGVGANLLRFQATAFSISRCFTQSQGFSCVTCHDPHSDAGTSPAAYEAACLSCHHSARHLSPAEGTARPAAAVSPPGAAPLPSVTARVCPVNARAGCISCHMPAGSDPLLPHSTFHQHWIRVWRTSEASPGAASAHRA